MSTLDASLILMSQHVAMISNTHVSTCGNDLRPSPDFSSQLWGKIWEWPEDEAMLCTGIVSNTQFGHYWSVLCTSPVQKDLCVQPLKPYIIIKLHPVAFPSNSNTTLNNFIFVCVKALVWWQLASSTQLIWPLAILLVSVYVPFQYKKAVHACPCPGPAGWTLIWTCILWHL